MTPDLDLDAEAMAEVDELVALLQIDNFLPAGLNFGHVEEHPEEDDRVSADDVSDGEDLIEVKNIKLEPMDFDGWCLKSYLHSPSSLYWIQ